MSHKNKVSMTKQVENILKSKLAIGESKHAAKQAGEHTKSIYSFSTLKSYMRWGNDFARFCKQEYHAKDIMDCRQYVDSYLQSRIDSGRYSPYSLKLASSSLAKLYGVSSTDFIKTPPRTRPGIVRSRQECVRDSHFSAARNANLVSVSHCSGLRRHELQALKPEHLQQNPQGKWTITVPRGKNGMSRTVELVGTKAEISQVVQFIQSCTTEKVFPQGIHNGFDAHGGRRIFAQRCYDQWKRPLSQLQGSEKLYTRCGDKGCFDRDALRKTSQQLGHHRVHISLHYVTASKG